MLVALHSRYIRDACIRIPFVNHHSALIASLAASRRLSQSRHFHLGLVCSVTRNGARTLQGTTKTTPQAGPQKTRASPINKTCVPWSKDEKERFQFLYSDGKEPTAASIMALFPGRSRGALYNRLLIHKGGLPRQNWSPEDEARLLELHNAGVSAFDMFKHFPDRTQQAVMKKLNRTLPGSYFSNRRRMVSSFVLGEEDRAEGGDHSCDQNEGAIVTAVPVRKRMAFWTDEEDDALRSLAQKAKERNPDRWARELSQLLSDPKERKGLATTRTLALCNLRLIRLEARPFVAKTYWTESENNLLMKSVYSRLGVQLNSTSYTPSNSHQKTEDNDGSSQSEQTTGTLKNHMEKKQWPEISIEDLKTLDWHQVALDVGTRDSHACRQRFDSHFKLKKGQPWTVKETELLKEGLRKYGRDWTMVASVVGTRTATQALIKYGNLVAQMEKLTNRPQGSLGKDLKK